MAFPGTHAYVGAITPAKPAFGNFNRYYSCRERLDNIRISLLYCECQNNNRPVKSQSDMLALRKIKNQYCPGYCNILPFNKANLQVNLITKLDMSGAVLVSSLYDPETPSGMYFKNPYYDYYYFDPYGTLFGKTQCGINKYVNYMVVNTIPFKLKGPPPNLPLVDPELN